MSTRSTSDPASSPRLPTFGIRNLNDQLPIDECQPDLISITARQYTATVQSQPDACLKYLDEDDGEVITVGTSMELKQRLDDPVPQGDIATFNPDTGKPIHIFDITRSSGSLAEWRDHEAYSSKYLRSIAKPASASGAWTTSEIDLPTVPTTEPISPSSTESIPRSVDLPVIEAQIVKRVQEPKSDAEAIADTIVQGIEHHLNGLAAVLQVAADALQKAAQKTRATNTSVVEDILTGVKGILTEVGSLGLDMLDTMHNVRAEPVSNEEASGEPRRIEIDSVDKNSDEVAEEALNSPLTMMPADWATCSSHSAPSQANSTDTGDTVRETVTAHATGSHASLEHSVSLKSVSSLDLHEREALGSNPAFSEVNVQPVSPTVLSTKSRSDSILDRDPEDLDFTARYPPLPSIRRAQTVGGSTQRYQPYSRKLASDSGMSEKFGPWTSAETGRDTFEVAYRPLPGAWPDAKTETYTAVPESSGAFFNRMTGRTRQNDEENGFAGTNGLRRANTTASANPASRLNRPFDPSDLSFSKLVSVDDVVTAPSRPTNPFADAYAVSGQYATYSDADEQSSNSKSPWLANAEDFYSAMPRVTPSRHDIESPARYHLRPRHAKSIPDFSASERFREKRAAAHDRFYTGGGYVPDIEATSSSASVKSSTSCMARPTPAQCNLMPSSDILSAEAGPSTRKPTTTQHRAFGSRREPLSDTLGNESPRSSVRRAPHILRPSRSVSFVPSERAAAPDSRATRRSRRARPYSNPFVYESPWDKLAAVQVPDQTVDQPADKVDECLQKLQDFGFGVADPELRERLHVYAVAANGDVLEAIDLIEEDKQMAKRLH